MPRQRGDPPGWLLAGLALAVVALVQIGWLARSTLLPDEAYYWDWSRRPAWGYVDHPPLVAWIIHLTGGLGGESGVRLGMLVCGLGTIALAYATGDLLGGPIAGRLCLGMAATCPLFMLVFDFAAPDAPLLFLWAGTVYAVARAITTDHGRYWFLAGLTLGLALLAKYTAVLLVPSLALFLLCSRAGWGRRKEPYLAGLLALLVWSPNLWWNARRGWVSVTFQTGHGACVAAARSVQYPIQAALYVENQITLVGPALAALLGVGTAVLVCEAILKRDDGALLLACCTLVIAVFFFVIHGVRHWAAPGYFAAMVGTGVVMARAIEQGDGRKRGLLVGVYGLALVIGAGETVALQAAYITHTGRADQAATGPLLDLARKVDATLMQPEPPWRAAAGTIARSIGRLPAHDRRAVIVADGYQTAAELAFYLPNQPIVYSGSHQYLLWEGQATRRGPAIYVEYLGPADRSLLAPYEGETIATIDVRAGGDSAGTLRATLVAGDRRLAALLAGSELRRWSCQ